MVKNLTTEEFKNEIFNYEENEEWAFKGDIPVVIDFHAEWCGPCKTVGPVLEEIDDELDGKINLIKIDIEKEQELAGIFGIRSIPSILFVPKEGQPQMAQGAIPKNTIMEIIDKIMDIKN